MFRTKEDRLKEKKMKAIRDLTIDENAFGLDSFDKIDNFYDDKVKSNQTSNGSELDG